MKQQEVEPKYIQRNHIEKIDEYKIKLNSLIGSGFDSWNILKTLPTWCRMSDPIKTSRALITVKNFTESFYGKKIYKGKPQYKFTLQYESPEQIVYKIRKNIWFPTTVVENKNGLKRTIRRSMERFGK